MNVNWKEAILQAQKKIDQVLDIRPETVEVEEPGPEQHEEFVDQNCSSPSQSSEPLGDDIVMLEPVLPPFLNNRYIGDDIQTIISSDIEHLTRASSRTASPERIKYPTDFEKETTFSQASHAPSPTAKPEVTLPNPEDILNQAIYGLRKELTEYKKANQILQISHANLERDLEENRFLMNQKMVNMLNEEREHSNQEMLQVKLTCSQAITEKLEIEEKHRNSENQLHYAKKSLGLLKNQIGQVKRSLKETGETLSSDFESFGAEIRRTLDNQVRRKKIEDRSPQIVKLPCNCAKPYEASTVKHDESIQTDPMRDEIQNSTTEETSPTGKASGNVTDLLQIIEQLEMEKRQLLVQRRSDKYEIERLREQLNETLIMHGEKIEQLDEIMVDNEELKNILKQQALALTINST